MSQVFTSTIARFLEETLDSVVTDTTEGYQKQAQYNKYFDVDTLDRNWIDDSEMAGPAFVAEKPEGQAMALLSLTPGFTQRYRARTFAGRIAVSEEAMEDNRYQDAINAKGNLARAMWQTVDFDAALVLVRMFDSNFPIGDGKALCASDHPLAGGGSASNLLATPMAPSRTAVTVATSQIRVFPGHDGARGKRYKPERVLAPVEQWDIWDELTLSTKAPEAGQFNRINVVNRLNLDVQIIDWWTNTTTNWALQTDARNGFRFLWRVKPQTRTWTDNGQTEMNSGMRARWDRGVTNWRSVLGVNA